MDLLRHYADEYEQSQQRRIRLGEQNRAVLLGRDPDKAEIDVGDVDDDLLEAAEDELERIKAGDSDGPIPALGIAYRRHHNAERDAFDGMKAALDGHPAWEWLEQVKGIGPTLACKLLARLDPRKADTPSSFWAYCGLATVPANKYRCPECSLTRSWPVGFNVTGKHQALGGGKCDGSLEKVAGPDDGIRCAQPRPSKGQKASYDQYAKKICYQVGTQFLKVRGNSPYERLYRRHRNRLERDRPGWADGRKHLTALRIVEKLFLAHLWLVWREAEGLEVTEPYAEAELGHDGIIGPWEMVGDGKEVAA